MRPCRIALVLIAFGVLPGLGAAAVTHPPTFTAHRGPYRKVARFVVTYTGSGSYSTTYHSRPPNKGGKPDTNTANDSSTQRWSLTFRSLLSLPACGPSLGARDPCGQIGPLSGARGRASVSARISHVHVDGLFKDQDVSERCHMSAVSPAGVPLGATIDLRYDPQRRAISVTALDPVSDASDLLPAACPNQGDPLDGLSDNYYGPGFSFNPAYGPQRWFVSRTVVIPTSMLHRAVQIRIPLGETPTGTPPRGCDVPAPAYERCSTGGSWRGVITLRAHR